MFSSLLNRFTGECQQNFPRPHRFRQASRSSIITFAHQINQGETPKIGSPFKHPELWKSNDCSPMNRGSLGTGALNKMLQEAVNPPQEGRAEIRLGERLFRTGDRVIHRRNNYDLGVFNGDIGKIIEVNNADLTLRVRFFPVQREQLTELELAYAITIHKAQGSEFEVVILPVLTQHFRMLFRNQCCFLLLLEFSGERFQHSMFRRAMQRAERLAFLCRHEESLGNGGQESNHDLAAVQVHARIESSPADGPHVVLTGNSMK